MRGRGELDPGERDATARKQDTVEELSLDLPTPRYFNGGDDTRVREINRRRRRIRWDFYENAATAMGATML